MTNRDRELKYRFTAEGGEVKRELRETAEGLEGVGKATDRVGQTADVTSGSLSRLSGSFGNLLSSWFGIAAVATAIIGFFKELAASAAESARAVADLGRGMRGLAANIGGERADRVLSGINAIARDMRFGPEGRSQLVEAAGALTDFREGLSNEQIDASLRNLAMLQRATGVGGQEGFRTANALQANLGLSESEAVDAATTLLNSGFEASTVQQLAERGGNVGGLEFMALILAARSKGLNIAQSGRQSETLVAALNRRGPDGGLAPELARAGVTDQMGLVARLGAISSARAAGTITQGQFDAAIGGAQNIDLVAPLQRAMADPAALARARLSLRDDRAVETAVDSILQSSYVQAAEEADALELIRQRASEESGRAGLGQFIDTSGTVLQDAGGGSKTVGFWTALLNPTAAYEAEARALYARGIRSEMLQPAAAARAVGVSTETYLRNTRPRGAAVPSPTPAASDAPDGMSSLGAVGGAVQVYNDYSTRYMGLPDPVTTPSDRSEMFGGGYVNHGLTGARWF